MKSHLNLITWIKNVHVDAQGIDEIILDTKDISLRNIIFIYDLPFNSYRKERGSLFKIKEKMKAKLYPFIPV
jgi:hypothetical protein